MRQRDSTSVLVMGDELRRQIERFTCADWFELYAGDTAIMELLLVKHNISVRVQEACAMFARQRTSSCARDV